MKVYDVQSSLKAVHDDENVVQSFFFILFCSIDSLVSEHVRCILPTV